MNLIKSWPIPIQTVSEGNQREHWHKAASRHTEQRYLVRLFLRHQIDIFQNQKITVKLIRISSRKLDSHDNLPMAFKYIVDAIADLLNPGKASGRSDDSDLIKWEYGQEKGEPKEKSIRVEIYKEI